MTASPDTSTQEPPETRLCVIFLFNHKYEKNIAILESMYAERFAHRHYIMPFSGLDQDNVSTVYEASWNFGGHIAQSAADYVDDSYTHYVFVADDLILNPALNDDTLLDALQLGPDTGYVKSLTSTDSVRYTWPWSAESAMSLRKYGRGFDYRGELPSVDVALEKYAALGITFEQPKLRTLHDLRFSFVSLPRMSPWAFAMSLGVLGKSAEYPLVCGYADFLVVPQAAMADFVHYCGVLTAMNIFAEVAVPTALALAAPKLRTELATGQHFMDPDAVPSEGRTLIGKELWDPADIRAFAERIDGDRDRLVSEFPAEWLYVHPMKLSAFRVT